MIRFIQSYAVPESIGDSTIFKAVVSHFKDDVVVVPFYSERVRNLSKKECINIGFQNYKEAKMAICFLVGVVTSSCILG